MMQQHTMVWFITRLGIRGNLAYLHSQVKKATMANPPTTNMAMSDPTTGTITSAEATDFSSVQLLTVLVPVIGTGSKTERQEDQGKGETEEDETESVDPSSLDS